MLGGEGFGKHGCYSPMRLCVSHYLSMGEVLSIHPQWQLHSSLDQVFESVVGLTHQHKGIIDLLGRVPDEETLVSYRHHEIISNYFFSNSYHDCHAL